MLLSCTCVPLVASLVELASGPVRIAEADLAGFVAAGRIEASA